MKSPVVDYRSFRLSRINEPQFRHLKLLWGWIGYFIMYVLTENLIPAERCTSVHMWLDDVIPFCEWFVIPYVFWYGLVAFTLIYFLLRDVESFRGFQIFIIVTQVVAMAAYIFFPSRQDLRPVAFERDNVLTKLVGLLYALDTNTGVCPSLHVAYSLSIASVWLKQKDVAWYWKTFILVCVVLICLSTMFIKQHSATDFFAALPVCLLAEWIGFGNSYWKPRFAQKHA